MNEFNDLNSNIEQLQGSNGIIDDLNVLIKKFEEKKLDEYKTKELDKYFAKFLGKYNLISSHYEAFIAAYIDTDDENEKQTIKLYLDYCLMFLNRIQNKYTNPIQYRINQINTDKSLTKANLSIYIGVFSILLALALTLFPNLIPINKKMDNDFRVILKNDSINFKEVKSEHKQLNSQFFWIGNRLDSIIKVMPKTPHK
jgi:hypothetical protein